MSIRSCLRDPLEPTVRKPQRFIKAGSIFAHYELPVAVSAGFTQLYTKLPSFAEARFTSAALSRDMRSAGVSKRLLDGKEVIIVRFACCDTGDSTVIDKETGEVLGYSLGIY